METRQQIVVDYQHPPAVDADHQLLMDRVDDLDDEKADLARVVANPTLGTRARTRIAAIEAELAVHYADHDAIMARAS